MKINFLENLNHCSCGKNHLSDIKNILIGKNTIEKLPEELKNLNTKKAFLLTDKNAYNAAGERVINVLSNAGIPHSKYIFKETKLEPDEFSVGRAIMHYDHTCDVIIGIGSGVINDISKILSKTSNKPYIIVATAPSMDGYASSTSSMSMDGLKVSLSSKCADVIIGDTDILKSAPIIMQKAGLGDILAKYISICEWRISNLITGEYYCESIANLVRSSLKKCVDNATGLLNRDETSVEAVFEGLVICGIAMAYAGISRPASGVEHYFSHIWDMRGLEFGIDTKLHGIQCAYGTYLSVKLYNQIKKITPDKQKGINYAKSFDFEKWSYKLKDFLGNSSNVMIAQEEKEQKYNVEKHEKRLDIIIEKWDEILEIINQELPDFNELKEMFEKIGLPLKCESIGVDSDILPMTFESTKDIRDKYVLSRLAWDLGIIDELNISDF